MKTKIGKWINNSKEPLQEIEEVQFCKPDPHLGWVDWQDMIVAYSIDGSDDIFMMFGAYFPESDWVISKYEYDRLIFLNDQWFMLKEGEAGVLADIYAYFFVSPMPNFDNPEDG